MKSDTQTQVATRMKVQVAAGETVEVEGGLLIEEEE